MKKSGVFEETYLFYLDQLEAIDIQSKAGILGAGINNNSLIIPFYNQDYTISLKHGVTGTDNTPVPFAIRVVLLKYILMAPDSFKPETDPYVTFREFKSAAPLTSFFTVNTNKIIETGFSGRLLHLTDQCRKMGGSIDSGNRSYDLSVSFNALPRIPVQLNFNDADDEFPAVSSILYRKSAELFLDMECLSITGTYLAGNLISPVGLNP